MATITLGQTWQEQQEAWEKWANSEEGQIAVEGALESLQNTPGATTEDVKEALEKWASSEEGQKAIKSALEQLKDIKKTAAAAVGDLLLTAIKDLIKQQVGNNQLATLNNSVSPL